MPPVACGSRACRASRALVIVPYSPVNREAAPAAYTAVPPSQRMATALRMYEQYVTDSLRVCIRACSDRGTMVTRRCRIVTSLCARRAPRAWRTGAARAWGRWPGLGGYTGRRGTRSSPRTGQTGSAAAPGDGRTADRPAPRTPRHSRPRTMRPQWGEVAPHAAPEYRRRCRRHQSRGCHG